MFRGRTWQALQRHLRCLFLQVRWISALVPYAYLLVFSQLYFARSFSILLWQMLKAETPFEIYTTVKSFKNKVVEGGVRPATDPKWPDDLSTLLRNSWSPTVSKRPHMEEVGETLRAIINRHTDEEIEEIMDASRRSELSLRNGNNQK